MIPPYFAVVVQAQLVGVRDDSSALATMRQNAQRVAETIERLVSSTSPAPRLVLFPLLCLTGPYRQARGVRSAAIAVKLPSPVFDPIQSVCQKHDLYFSTSFQERLTQFPGHYFHTSVVLGPEGVVLRSPKAQVFSAPGITTLRDLYDEYTQVFGQEAVLPVADTSIGRLGCLLESEVLVPEAARLLASKGAQVILNPGAERGLGTTKGYAFVAGAPPYDAVKQAVAYATGSYLLSASPAREAMDGAEGEDEWFGGASTIVGPDGRFLARLEGTCEGAAIARIDLQRQAEVRAYQERDTRPVDILYRDLYR